VIINEPQFPEPVHEKANLRPRRRRAIVLKFRLTPSQFAISSSL
jgi:hypothetical protein